MTNSRHVLLVFLNSSLLCLSATQCLTARDLIRTVALTGDRVFDAGPEVFLNILDPPSINEFGQTAFNATLKGSGVENSSFRAVLKSDSLQNLVLVARSGDPVPGTNGSLRVFDFGSSYIPPVINDLGQTAFYAAFNDRRFDSPEIGGIYSEGGGNGLKLIARTDTIAPGTQHNLSPLSSLYFRSFSYPKLNNNGRVAFSSSLALDLYRPTVGTALFFDDPKLELSLIAGTQGTTTQSERTIEAFRLSSAHLNDNDELYFSAYFGYAQQGNNNLQTYGLFLAESGESIVPVFQPGVSAPQAGADAKLATIEFPDFDGSFSVFTGILEGNGIDFTNYQAIYTRKKDESLNLVARQGDPAPGASEGVIFRSLFGPRVNKSGETVFDSVLSGTDIEDSDLRGIFGSRSDGSLRLIARKGLPAPGTEEGVSFDNGFLRPAINGSGQVIFEASLVGPGVESTNDGGIWAEDRDGNLQLILRRGEVLNVSDDPEVVDFRTVAGFDFMNNFSGNDSGSPTAFSDRGQIGFVARFTDGTYGVFVSDLATIPEPQTIYLILFCAFLLYGRNIFLQINHSR